MDFQRKSHYSLCLPGCPLSFSNFNGNWDRNRGCRELNSLLGMTRWFKDESSAMMLPQSNSQCELNNDHSNLDPLAGPPLSSAPPDNPLFEHWPHSATIFTLTRKGFVSTQDITVH